MRSQVAQGGQSGIVSAHTVDASAGGCRRGAQVQPTNGCGVRNAPQRRAGDELGQVENAPINVAADVVGVIRLTGGWPRRVAGDDMVEETGGEPFDVGLYEFSAVALETVRDVAVSPE